MKTKPTLSELLQKTPKSDLEALLLEFAMNDKHIEKMLRIRLSTDVSEVQRVKEEIIDYIRDYIFDAYKFFY